MKSFEEYWDALKKENPTWPKAFHEEEFKIHIRCAFTTGTYGFPQVGSKPESRIPIPSPAFPFELGGVFGSLQIPTEIHYNTGCDDDQKIIYSLIARDGGGNVYRMAAMLGRAPWDTFQKIAKLHLDGFIRMENDAIARSIELALNDSTVASLQQSVKEDFIPKDFKARVLLPDIFGKRDTEAKIDSAGVTNGPDEILCAQSDLSETACSRLAEENKQLLARIAELENIDRENTMRIEELEQDRSDRNAEESERS